MVRKIIWTKKAELIFQEILEFYFKRNGNKIYSATIKSEIEKALSLISKHPYIGMKVENKTTRILINGNYKIFYEIESDKIIVMLIWDSRQNNNNLKI